MRRMGNLDVSNSHRIRLHFWEQKLLTPEMQALMAAQLSGRVYLQIIQELKPHKLNKKGQPEKQPALSKDENDTFYQIYIDMLRTKMPFSKTEQLPERIQLACQRILYVLSCRALPNMGYCQGLNYVACLFYFLCGEDEQRTFELLFCFIVSFNL